MSQLSKLLLDFEAITKSEKGFLGLVPVDTSTIQLITETAAKWPVGRWLP